LTVAVLGAGIGGLAAARALRADGVAVTVYEQAKQFARVGAGINLTPNATRCLFALGLREPLVAQAVAPPYRLSRTWDTGEVTSRLELGADAQERYGAPFLQLHRADLHEILLTGLDAPIHLDHKLGGYERCPDGRVKLHFESGEEAVADVLVAADGIHSKVREQMLGLEQPHFTNRVAYRGTLPSTDIDVSGMEPYVKWWGGDRHIVIYQISAGKEFYFVTSVPEASWKHESWSTRGDLAELRAEFAGFHRDVQMILAACTETYKWALFERDPLPTWTDPDAPVVLMGDAAHPMVPYMAQGAATALEDAIVLSRHLSEGVAGPDAVSSRLVAFQDERLPRTSTIQLEARQNRWLRYGNDPAWVYDYDATSRPA